MTEEAGAAVELRPVSADDFEAVRQVYESIAAEGRWIGAELPIDWDARRPLWEASWSDPRWFVLLALVEGRAVGWLSAQHDDGGRVGVGMGLIEGYRSMGIGTKLLAAAIGWAKHRGAHKVVLEVWPHNERAIGLYEKFGFEIEGRHPKHHRRNDGELWDSISMGLVL